MSIILFPCNWKKKKKKVLYLFWFSLNFRNRCSKFPTDTFLHFNYLPTIINHIQSHCNLINSKNRERLSTRTWWWPRLRNPSPHHYQTLIPLIFSLQKEEELVAAHGHTLNMTSSCLRCLLKKCKTRLLIDK